MKSFTKKMKRKSILVLLSLFAVFFLLSVTFTMSKYVIEKPVGNITLNVTGADVLLPGLQVRNALDDSVTEVVFGLTKDYEDEIAGIEPKSVDVNKKGKIKLYAVGTRAYILSDRKIYANPDSHHLFYHRKELTSVDFSNFDAGIVTDMRGMFIGCTKLAKVKNITSWNTKNVEDMEFLFRDCTSLTTLDLSGWNTAKVTDLYGAFYNCSSLTSLDVSTWDTSAVEHIGDVFWGCSKLTSLDVSKWNTESVTHMHYAFYNCSSLTTLDLSGWKIDGPTDMGYIFYNCSSLTSLDLSSWNTSEVTIMKSMFYGCSSLTSLNVSTWNTGKVLDMYFMFRGCQKLAALDISSWKAESVTDMYCMFYDCGSLTSLDFSLWNTASVTNMDYMFFNCGKLVSIYAGSGWNTDNVTSSVGMFQLCQKLSGGQGTSYDSVHMNKAYARIDGGTANPGYFTDIADKP